MTTLGAGFEIVAVRPEPTQAERVAIVAAVEAFGAELWPHASDATVPEPSPRWRYAGRRWRRRASYGGWA